MPAPPKPPPPDKPVIKRDGFSIKDGVITCNGHERVDATRLSNLYHPDKAGARAQKKLAEDAKRLFTRPFFAAQLKFYGISFPKTSTEPQLKSLLDKAVLARKCDAIPPSVIRILQELRLDYQREVDAWQKLVDNWDAEWRRQQDEEWAQLETPAERANYDLDRFMEHYFLTDGNPDPAKKPEPLALEGLTDEATIAELLTRVTLVPGLDTVTAGPWGGSGEQQPQTICIGWDRTALCGLAVDIENLVREQKRLKVEADWAQAMRKHSDFIIAAEDRTGTGAGAGASASASTNHNNNNTNNNNSNSSSSNDPMALSNARGYFIVRCKAIADKYPDHPNLGNMAVSISDSPAHNGETLRASVDLGVCVGTAVLAFSQPVMDWFVRYYDNQALEAATRANNHSTSTTPSFGSRTAGQQQQQTQTQTQTTINNKRKAVQLPPPQSSEALRPSKKPRANVEPVPGRVLLRMRARDLMAGGGAPCADVLHGYFDFGGDGNWATFEGVCDVPGVGVDLAMEGFRVGNEAVVQPEPWGSFWPA